MAIPISRNSLLQGTGALAQGLEALGGSMAAADKSQKLEEEKELAKTNRAEAFKLLAFAQQTDDPEQQRQAYAEAYRRDPEGVTGFVKMQKDRMSMAPETAKPMTEFQKVSVDLRQQTIDMQKDQNEIEKLQRKEQKETNDLKKREIQFKIDEKKRDAEEKRKAVLEGKQDAINTMASTLDSIGRLRTHPGLSSAAGIDANFTTFAGSDASNFEKELESLQSQQFLSAVKAMRGMGSLSESEGKKIASAVSSLSTEMSDEALRAELDRIYEVMDKAISIEKGRLPKDSASPEKPKVEIIEWDSF